MSVLGLTLGAAAVHVLPNTLMKVVKSTHFGHKLLTASFELGLEGKELTPMAKDILGYVVGPETLVEYQLGLKLRAELSEKVFGLDVDFAISMFRKEMKEEFAELTKEELEDCKKTPFISTLHMFATEDISPVKEKVESIICGKNKKRSIKNFITYIALATGAVVVDPVAILQPAICQLRKTIGTSEFGKGILRNNFNKGVDGKSYTKSYEVANDFLIAPSVLDTQRLGLFVNKYQDNEKLTGLLSLVK